MKGKRRYLVEHVPAGQRSGTVFIVGRVPAVLRTAAPPENCSACHMPIATGVQPQPRPVASIMIGLFERQLDYMVYRIGHLAKTQQHAMLLAREVDLRAVVEQSCRTHASLACGQIETVVVQIEDMDI